MNQTAVANRREHGGERKLLAKDAHREITFVYGDRAARTEADVLKRPSVFAQSDFILCSTIQVVKHRLRQPPSSETPEILDVDYLRRSERVMS
jgi:hypothetical protein